MERHSVIKQIRAMGWEFSRQGGSHEIWAHELVESYLAVPRSKRLSGGLAKLILTRARKALVN